MGDAAVEPNSRAVTADDYAVTVVLDFVNPVGAGRRFRSFERLSRDNEPGRKRLVFHSAKKIGRRSAGNNELSVGFSLGLQLCRQRTRGRALQDRETLLTVVLMQRCSIAVWGSVIWAADLLHCPSR
jgi:hypothetical protein